jgi:selenide,water dikinase
LAQVLRPVKDIFEGQEAPDLIVGLGDPDDAAVWRLDDERALVVTTDFFTPVVDTPYEYGAIAAANSLSDIYAMGGVPFLALNIANLPPDLPAEISSEILRGGAEKAREAGVIIAGGHTVQDEEPKYGLVALGLVDPAKVITKGGARVGDQLVLTKPLGFGTTSTAIKRELASQAEIDEVVGWMMRLNDRAGQLAREFDLRGGTDVTGFSLLGHGSELANASGVGLRLRYAHIPFTASAERFGKDFVFPGGSHDNRDYFGAGVQFDAALADYQRMLLFDPQTSGGLLLAVPPEKLPDFEARAAQLDQAIWVIGEVVEGKGLEVTE